MVNGTISPSGRIYSKEAILEYLLAKTKEIKELEREHEIEKVCSSWICFIFFNIIFEARLKKNLTL